MHGRGERAQVQLLDHVEEHPIQRARLRTRRVRRQIRAAEDWERSGSAGEAETAYRRALSAFDSFLLSPRGRRRLSPELADHLAEQPAGGERGVLMAMGPGFCAELVLLRWH